MKNPPHPTKEICQTLLQDYGTPPHVIRHCQAVSKTAVRIAKALNHKGYSLNLDLIQGAALLHDIARTEDKHWEKGAALLRSLGYPQEADIVKDHMHYRPPTTTAPITEKDMVCLADRLVKEDTYVGLDARMDYIIAKAKSQGHHSAEQEIQAKKKEVQTFIHRLEAILQTSLNALMSSD